MFCACSCEDVSCARGFENDIMSLSALKFFKRIEVKNGTLKVSKPLICEDEKKVRLHLLLTVGKDSTTSIFLES